MRANVIVWDLETVPDLAGFAAANDLVGPTDADIKPAGIGGNDVERYFLEGRIKEIADYCETDVVNTYRVWLRHELFRGRLTESEHQASERYLVDVVAGRASAKTQLR